MIATPRLRAVLAADGQEITVAAGHVVALPAEDTLIAGFVGTDPGVFARLELDGRRIDRRGPAGRVRAGLAVVSGTAVAGELGVRDHLAASVGVVDADALLATTPLLAGRARDPAGVLSGGERRVLAWLMATAARPRAVVLDRAGTGLDADAMAWAHRTIDRWLDESAAVAIRVARAEETRWITHGAGGRPRAAGTSPSDV